MDLLLPKRIDTEDTEPPKEASSVETPKVVVAPVMHGRSFKLRASYGPHYSIGQMLMLVDKQHYGLPKEVIGVLFPTDKAKHTGFKKDRVFLGDRKLGKRFIAEIMEIKLVPGEPMQYRLLYPSGTELQAWGLLDLSKLRLKTTEEQRAFITAFTGVLYKTQEPKARKPRTHTHKPMTQGVLNDAQVQTLKKKIKA